MEIMLVGVGAVSFFVGAGVKILLDWQKSRKPGILSMGQARTIGLAYADPEIKDIFTTTNKNKRAKKAQLLLVEQYAAREKYSSKLKENEKTAEKIRQELNVTIDKARGESVKKLQENIMVSEGFSKIQRLRESTKSIPTSLNMLQDIDNKIGWLEQAESKVSKRQAIDNLTTREPITQDYDLKIDEIYTALMASLELSPSTEDSIKKDWLDDITPNSEE